MGTDIHFYIEKKNKDDKWEKVIVPDEILPRDRDYFLFAVLAGVRNGTGFAGCEIFKIISPYFEGRGIPSDTSCQEIYDEDGDCDPRVGDHSQTWATLEELIGIDWDIPCLDIGYVDRKNYELLKKGENPKESCGDINGYHIKKTKNLDKFEKDKSFTHVQVQWYTSPLKKCYFRTFIEEVLPRAAGVWRKEDRKSVRVLIGFDS